MSARDLPLLDLLAELAATPRVTLAPGAVVEPGAVMAEYCIVKTGAVIAAGTRLGRRVKVGANAVFIEPEGAQAGTRVEDGATIGANAVIYADLTLGAGCVVRPGSVVKRDVPAGAIVEGFPAVLVGWAKSADLPTHTGAITQASARPAPRDSAFAELGA